MRERLIRITPKDSTLRDDPAVDKFFRAIEAEIEKRY